MASIHFQSGLSRKSRKAELRTLASRWMAHFSQIFASFRQPRAVASRATSRMSSAISGHLHALVKTASAYSALAIFVIALARTNHPAGSSGCDRTSDAAVATALFHCIAGDGELELCVENLSSSLVGWVNLIKCASSFVEHSQLEIPARDHDLALPCSVQDNSG